MSNRCRTLLFFFVPIIAILSAVFFAASAFADERGGEEATTVFVMRVSGMISPVASDFVASSLRKAADIDAQIIILELDTPGGLDTSMRAIVKEMNASRTPIVVYVAPSGARAASAGAFITIAAHVAAMSPGTNIGAAHPVAVGEKMDPVMAEKATNDAAAYIRSLAEQHGRNAVWAEDAVRKSISATESEALKLGVIDLIATDRADLMKQLDGRVVRTAAGNISLRTAKPVIINEEMGFRHRLLSFVSDPTVAYLLMMIGFYGIFFELSNPGTIAPGIIGAISLVLAFYAFQTLPVNYAGLILIVIGIILFVLEIKVTSYGLLTLGGISCLTLGSLMLYDSTVPLMRLSLSVIIPAVLVSATFFFLTIRLAVRSQRARVTTGSEGLVGEEGIARENIGPDGGTVLIHGELWSAYAEERIQAGSPIVIRSVKGLRVKVVKKPIS